VGKVITGATMSLDGYIAGPGESGFDLLFDWYENGPLDVPTAQPERTFHMTPENAAVWVDVMDRTGALVVGRHLFVERLRFGGLLNILVIFDEICIVVTHLGSPLPQSSKS